MSSIEPAIKRQKLAAMPEQSTISTESHKSENGHVLECENGLANNGKEMHGNVKNGQEDQSNDVTANDGDNSVLLVKRLSEDAFLPIRGSKSAAGFDLHSSCSMKVEAKNKALVPTQLAITVPYGSYGRIAPRSGLAWKKFIDVGAGVIDHDYTGEVKVVLFNFSENDFEIEKGDRIAQLVIEKIFIPDLVEVDDLTATNRGGTGFGASGK
eukprot:gene19429-21351_t